MRHAPPVLVPVGRFVWGVRAAWGLAGVSLLVLLWVVTGLELPADRAALLATAWLLAAALCAWTLRRAFVPPGELAWDGQDWWYSPRQQPPVQVRLTPVWDLGGALLLALQCPSWQAPRHVWLQANQLRSQWHGLRCAVWAAHTL